MYAWLWVVELEYKGGENSQKRRDCGDYCQQRSHRHHSEVLCMYVCMYVLYLYEYSEPIHICSTACVCVYRYSELLEGMQSISPEKMPKLGPYIHPPSLYHSQEVYCVLTLRIFIARPQGFTSTTTNNSTRENNMLPDEKECETAVVSGWHKIYTCSM